MPDYFSKKARRAQEKVLQKLGKADETRDESFDEHVNNFNKQQAEVHKLHKEFKQYLSCLKDMKTAAFNLNEAISEVYDGEWGGYSELYSYFEDSKSIWNNLAQRLAEEVVSPFAIYQSQFPEFKSRIAKRGRKLIDYDACRHNLDSVKQKGKADDRKISQLEEEELIAKKIYEELNSQLSNELPAIYDSRVAFYVSTLHSYYATEMDFSKKILKLQEQLCDLVNKVVDGRSASSKSSPNIYSESLSAESASTTSTEKSPARERKKRQAPKVVKEKQKPANPFGEPDQKDDDNGKGNPFGEEEDEGKGNPFAEEKDEGKGNPFGDDDQEEKEEEAPGNPFGATEDEEKSDDEGAGNPFGNDDGDDDEESKDEDAGNPFGNADGDADENDSTKKPREEPKPAAIKSARLSKSSKTPDKVLYQVRAKANYVGNGSDVLSLIKGDYINVIGFDNDRTDKENEEWLIGIRRSDFVKGSFPASAVAKDTTL